MLASTLPKAVSNGHPGIIAMHILYGSHLSCKDYGVEFVFKKWLQKPNVFDGTVLYSTHSCLDVDRSQQRHGDCLGFHPKSEYL